ncbi:MAG TPA: ABC transporter ATP-binding protein [Anaerolineales bacterium]|nr:ABC transporter ATP-binding protein [Anaerolineales bacterium]
MAVTEFTVHDVIAGDRRSPALWAWSHARRSPWVLTMFVGGAALNAVLAASLPMMIGAAYTAVVTPRPDPTALLWVGVVIVVTQWVRSLFMFGRNFGAEIIGQRIERDSRSELYASLLGKSMTFHGRHSVGEVMARATNDVRELNLMFNPGVNLVIGSTAFLVMPVLVSPGMHPQLVIVPALFLIAYFVAVWFYLRELGPITDSVRETFGRMNARLEEGLEGVETVKGFAREVEEGAAFSARAGDYRDAYVRQGRVEARYIPFLLFGLVLAFGFAHALWLRSLGVIAADTVVAYNYLLLLFGFPVFISLMSFSQIASGMASGRRILSLINTETELDENPGGYAGPMRGEVCFEDVSFDYGAGVGLLRDVSFTVAPGETVAVVGQTGSGKSSLIKLINRMYDVDSGAVSIDGRDVREWNLEALRQQISIIEQDIFLFSRTVGENIAFGKPGATQAEIEAAAHSAQAHAFITQFKDGYATLVGERGVTLSGGQRQRLALARAFLTNPRILVLDDSTSAIDSATEDEIQKAIFRAAAGRTTFIITHRLSQIRWADKILVLRQGRVAALGTHEDLMKSSEPYRRIFARYT